MSLPLKKVIAWAVHLFTASGLLAAFMAMLAAIEGNWRSTMLWLLLCLVIDGIDGTFARLAKVSEVLPKIKGKYIDYVIDFFTYAILPAYLYYETIELAEGWRLATTFLILLSSALYYGFEDMTSPDGKHFIGFPVLWNLVAYIFIFVLPTLAPAWKACLVVFFAIIHFVPIHFAYPSMGGRWWPISISTAIIFIGTAIWNVWIFPKPNQIGQFLALGCTAYFAVLAIVDTKEAWSKS